MLKLSTQFLMSLAVLALAALFLMGLPVSGWAEKGDLENIASATAKTHAPLYIPLGKAELIDLPGVVADVLVANPAIVDVTAVQAKRLYAVGLAVGDTNLIALDAEGNVIKKMDIHVKYDLDAIQTLIEELYPDEDIKVGSIHDQIILTGHASTPAIASKAANVVGHYVGDLQGQSKSADELVSNLMEIGGEQQVMLQVKIVEAARSVIKELGVETNLNDLNELSATTIFGSDPANSVSRSVDSIALSTGAGIALAQDPAATTRLLADTGLRGIGTIGVFLNALEDENLVNILAEPNLTAVSGEQAGFLAGGEFPTPVGRDQVGNVIIEFKQFGVSLNFRPTVLSEDRISLQMNTEVSSLDFENTVPIDGTEVPGLDVRRADTTVEIASGGSLMIAGLLQSKAAKGYAGLPGIAKTPVLGDLVKSRSFQRDETELVVFVTPYLVKPYAEKSRAEQVTKVASRPLSSAYADNIRKAFGTEDESLFSGNEPYGYLLE